jgi:3-oxoacyl-[acyl-carrier protein] reductase
MGVTRAAVVTGASRGIGRAICIALASRGVGVIVGYYRRRSDALETVRTIRATGGEAHAVQVDVSREASARRLIEAARTRFGRLDILVNNAALTDEHRPWTQVSVKDWEDSLDTNAKGAYLTFRAAYEMLRASGSGRIINIGSVTYDLGKENRVQYVASKGALVGFTRSLAREVGVDGITVNVVSPGAIRTEREVEMFPDAAASERQLFPLQAIKRLGEPRDIANAVAFFAAEESSFVTGQTLIVDGGWIMK